MRRRPRVPAVLSLPFRALAAAYDERNIRRLARHHACSMDEARQLYWQARSEGFGAAHESLFSGGSPVPAEVAEDHEVRDSRRA